MLWAIVEEKLRLKRCTNLKDLKYELNYIWNRIPIPLCEMLIQTFDKRIKWVYENGGIQYILKSDKKEKILYDWTHSWNENDKIERIVMCDDLKTKLKDRLAKSIKKIYKNLSMKLEWKGKFHLKKEKLQ